MTDLTATLPGTIILMDEKDIAVCVNSMNLTMDQVSQLTGRDSTDIQRIACRYRARIEVRQMLPIAEKLLPQFPEWALERMDHDRIIPHSLRFWAGYILDMRRARS